MPVGTKRMNLICVSLTVILGLYSVSAVYPASRPFWTEKSAFIEGYDLFVVGVASKVRTVEEARRQAFEQGKVELMNYAQVTSLEAQGLVIETQVTFEEANPDGTVTVYRLLSVPAAKLAAIQGRLQAQSKLQEQTLEQSRRELLIIQQSLGHKQQELETRSRGIQETLMSVSQLQVTLGEKAQKLDQQQRQVEQLLQQLSSKLNAPSPSSNKTKTAMAPLEALREMEARLDEKEKELSAIQQRALNRIQEHSKKACKWVKAGMTETEVRTLLGNPDGAMGFRWQYGTIGIEFNMAGIVPNQYGKDSPPLDCARR